MYENINREVGAKIKEIRERKLEVSREELAKRLDISRPSVANIEEGRQNITLIQIFQFSDVLGVSPYDLIPFERRSLKLEHLAESLPSNVTPELREWVKSL